MTGIATTTQHELASGGRRRMTRAVARRWPADVAIVAAASLAVASGCFVLAVGWLGHAVWGTVHHRAECVIPAGTRRPASSAT